MIPLWLGYGLLAALFGTVSIIFKKKALKKEHSLEYLATFKLAELLTLVVLVPFISFSIPWTTLGFIYFLTLFSTIELILIAKAYRHMDVSLVAPLTNFSPAIVLVLAVVLLREHISLPQLVGIGFIVLGSVGLYEPAKKKRKKYLTILAGALFIAGFVAVGEKYIIADLKPLTLLFYIYLFTFINSTILLALWYDGIKGIVHGFKNAGTYIFGNAVFATLSNIAYFYALTLTFVSLVVPVKKLATFFAVAVSGNVFNEKHILRKSSSCLVMLIGIFIIAVV